MSMTTPARDACDLLDADHIAVKHLFVEYARLAHARAVSDERLPLARQICDDLTLHAQLEEKIFYPALEQSLPDDADLVNEGRQEHAQVKKLIARIQGIDSADAKLDEAIFELAGLVEHHVKEERDELFPKARSANGIDMSGLTEQLSTRQQQLMS